MVTGLVKSEARNRGLRLGLTSTWRAARKERDFKNDGFIIMSVVVYLYYIGQLKVSLFACRSIFITFQFIKRKLAHTVLDPRQLFMIVSHLK